MLGGEAENLEYQERPLGHEYPKNHLSGASKPDLLRSLLRPLFGSLKDGLLIYHERRTLLIQLSNDETGDLGYGGTATRLGYLDLGSHPSPYPETWRFFNTWGNCSLVGSWLCAPYAGFSLLLDTDLVRLAKESVEADDLMRFMAALSLREKEWEGVQKELLGR
jgi:hypothetical protein